MGRIPGLAQHLYHLARQGMVGADDVYISHILYPSDTILALGGLVPSLGSLSDAVSLLCSVMGRRIADSFLSLIVHRTPVMRLCEIYTQTIWDSSLGMRLSSSTVQAHRG